MSKKRYQVQALQDGYLSVGKAYYSILYLTKSYVKLRAYTTYEKAQAEANRISLEYNVVTRVLDLES